MTMVELCIVILVLGILLVLATVALLRARVSANEGSARATLRTLHNAQISYAAGCGRGNFATSLVVLGQPPHGSTSGFVEANLAYAPVITRSGYDIRIGPGFQAQAGTPDCNTTATQTSYYSAAVPAVPGETGGFGYASNQRGTLWRQPNQAPIEPFAAPAEILR